MLSNDGPLYDILGVTRNATHEEIEQAFNNLAELNDPDIIMLQERPSRQRRNHLLEAAERLVKIVEAYHWLGSPDRRIVYNNFIDVGIAAMKTAEPWRNVSLWD